MPCGVLGVSGGRKIQPGQQQHSRPGQTNHPFHEISLGLGGRNYGIPCANCKHKNYGLAGILTTAWFTRATHCTLSTAQRQVLSPPETARVTASITPTQLTIHRPALASVFGLCPF